MGSLLVSYIIMGLVGILSLTTSFDSSKLALLMTAWMVSTNNDVGCWPPSMGATECYFWSFEAPEGAARVFFLPCCSFIDC